MSINKIKKKLKENSKQDSSWLDKAKWRQKNEAWLDISFAIAVKIISALRTNKKSGVYPKNQKEFAEAMLCTPQYVNKLLKGAENLQLETITKIEEILKIKLIQVPQFETTITIEKPVYMPFKKSENIVSTKISLSNYDDLFTSFIYESKHKEVA